MQYASVHTFTLFVYVHVCVFLRMYIQSSYEAGVFAVAESAGRVLWNHFTEEEEGAEGEKQGPKSIHYRVK